MTWAGLGLLTLLAPFILILPVAGAVAGQAFYTSATGRRTGAIGFLIAAPLALAGIAAVFWLFINAMAGNIVWWITLPVLVFDGIGIVLALLFRGGERQYAGPATTP